MSVDPRAILDHVSPPSVDRWIPSSPAPASKVPSASDTIA